MIISIATENSSKTKTRTKQKELHLHMKHAINPNSRKRCTQILIRSNADDHNHKKCAESSNKRNKHIFRSF